MKGTNNINLSMEYIPAQGPRTILDQIAYLTHDIDIVAWKAEQYSMNEFFPVRLNLDTIAFPFYLLVHNAPVYWYQDVRIYSVESYGVFDQWVPPGSTVLLMPDNNEIYAQGAAVIWVMAAQLRPYNPVTIGPIFTADVGFSTDFGGVIPIIVPLDPAALGFAGDLSPVYFPNVLFNGGFETGDLSGWATSGDPLPFVTSSYTPHSGTYCCLIGSLTTPSPTVGYSTINQTHVLPRDGANISFWHWDYNTDTGNNYQYVWVDDLTNGQTVVIFFHASNNQVWEQTTWTLDPAFFHAGDSVQLIFQVWNDPPVSGVTGMLLDDVRLS